LGAGQAKPVSAGAIVVRPCHGLAEFERCVELQLAIWGGAELDAVPLPVFVITAEMGGQVLGAFDGARMIGFTLAFPGLHRQKPFLHSHMTAVLEEFRDRGVGRQLKLFQRSEALGRGIKLVEWTFDPLELRNAHFNIVRLGAIARRILPNHYGITSSPLHAGLPTDRLLAEWHLNSPRAVARAEGKESTRRASSNAKLVFVPANIGELKRTDPREAEKIQSRVREEFQHWFAEGYAVLGLENTPQGASYILETHASPETLPA